MHDDEGNHNGVNMAESSSYPYATSWWHEQEFVSALPFDLAFPNINEQEIEGISDVVLKAQINASADKFGTWSWRPNLKIWDNSKQEWVSFKGNMFAYHDNQEDKLVWTGQESDLDQDQYDSVQKYRDPSYYFVNSSGKIKDNCTIIFKLSKDEYDFSELMWYNDVDQKSYIRMLGLTYIIPGMWNNNWEITYREDVDKSVSSIFTPDYSYTRSFRTTDVIKKNIETSNNLHGTEFDAPQSLAQPWIDLNGQLGSISNNDIARVVDVFGITSNPIMVSTLLDPTPEDPVGADYWRFERSEGRLYLPMTAILNYEQFNFTMELWEDLNQRTSPDTYIFDEPTGFNNITIIEDVIRDNGGGSFDYFTKNFDVDYSFYQQEAYFFSFNSDGSVDYIEFADYMNIDQGDTIRGITHNIGNYGTGEFQQKTNLELFNTLKFPFAIAQYEDSILLDLKLNLMFKAGFIGKESINNILESESDYDINLDFYKKVGSTYNPIGTIHLEDVTEVLNAYTLYDLSINLKKSGLYLKELFDCFASGKELVVNITAQFKGKHQGKFLSGKFALEILKAGIDTDLAQGRPSIDMVELIPTNDGVQYINMTEDFLHNPYYTDVVDLYGYDYATEQLDLIDPSDYYIGNLKYSDLFSRQKGTHTGNLYSIDRLDNEYLILSTESGGGTSLDYIFDGSYVPRQPNDFDIEYGTPDYAGDLNRVDSSISTITAETPTENSPSPQDIDMILGTTDGQGGLGAEGGSYTTLTPTPQGTGTAMIYPNSDTSTINWEYPSGTHWNDISSDDSLYIREDALEGSEWTNGVEDKFNFGTITLPSQSVVTRMRVYVLCQLDQPGATAKLYVKYGGSEYPIIEPHIGYQMPYVEISGLSLNQASVDAFQMSLICYNVNPNDAQNPQIAGSVRVDQLKVKLYYTIPERFISYTADMDAGASIQTAEDIKLYYTYDFTGTTTGVTMQFSVKNYDTDEYDVFTVNDLTENSYYQLTDSHVSSTNIVSVLMESSGFSSYQLELDQLRVYYGDHIMDVTTDIYTNGYVSNERLYYAYKVSNSQPLSFQIWDNLYGTWSTIDNDGSDDFQEHSYSLSSRYYDSNNKVSVRFLHSTIDQTFDLELDMLNVKNSIIAEEALTGTEDYFISIDYYSDDVDFDLYYGDDTGYNLIDTLRSTTKITFTAHFFPTLCDSPLEIRIKSNAASGNSIYLDRVVVSSNSTQEINDLVITSTTKYDSFYANLEFDNVPCLVDSFTENILMEYLKTGDVYYVFKIPDLDIDRQFIVNRIKITDPTHPQDITIIPRNIYHWADNEIYIEKDEADIFDPQITPSSVLHADYAYTYDSWKENEYVDTLAYEYNFTISDAQRIEAVSLVTTFTEIPQIQSWFFGATDDGTEFKQLTNKLYKNVNLLEIEFYNFRYNKWTSIDYVVYDLNDRDARTYAYFIDRIVLDFVDFDGLPGDDLLYQLKYRFKIDKNYFNDEYSTKTFFDMQDLTVQMYYQPSKSIIALNPQLEFSADITEVIHPEGNTGVTNYINEISFDIDWKYGVSITDAPIDGIDINAIFNQYTLYAQNPTLSVVNRFGNATTISKTNGKFVLDSSNSEEMSNYVQNKYGKYFVDFKLEYDWRLMGMMNYMYNYIFDISAYVELINCGVRAKTTSVLKELITPVSIPKNGSISVGNIHSDTQNDIGFMGGFYNILRNQIAHI
ncbi:MAG: hypothetical protein ACXACO_08195 [Promethearchaeota archaeon]